MEDKWRVRVLFVPLDVDDTGMLKMAYSTHEQAYAMGRQMACVAGALTVQVYAPDDDAEPAHRWCCKDNRWHDRLPRPS